MHKWREQCSPQFGVSKFMIIAQLYTDDIALTHAFIYMNVHTSYH